MPKTKPKPKRPFVLTTRKVIAALMSAPVRYRSTCGAYTVEMERDKFVLRCPSAPPAESVRLKLAQFESQYPEIQWTL